MKLSEVHEEAYALEHALSDTGGGHLVAQGTPEEVSKTAGSHTGYYLKRVLAKKKK
jgi:hypothetical protein